LEGALLNHRDIFNSIYSKNLWGYGSGTGSLAENTQEYRRFLHNFLRSNQIRSVVDIGCGDWQFSRLMDWKGIRYIGIDVSDVVLLNTQQFANDGVSFICADVRHEPLPSAELVLIKDVMQHWSNEDIVTFLPRLSQFQQALIINGFHPSLIHLLNLNISVGSCRPVDLRKAPFNLRGHYINWLQFDEPKWIFHWQRNGEAGT
jgi:SAM-dependent methyltransferase